MYCSPIFFPLIFYIFVGYRGNPADPAVPVIQNTESVKHRDKFTFSLLP
jgi:hypothetical protein